MEDFMGIKLRPMNENSTANIFADCSAFGRTSFPYAMAYVPMQQLGAVYSEAASLDRGTLFPELDKPFLAAERSNRL